MAAVLLAKGLVAQEDMDSEELAEVIANILEVNVTTPYEDGYEQFGRCRDAASSGYPLPTGSSEGFAMGWLAGRKAERSEAWPLKPDWDK